MTISQTVRSFADVALRVNPRMVPEKCQIAFTFKNITLVQLSDIEIQALHKMLCNQNSDFNKFEMSGTLCNKVLKISLQLKSELDAKRQAKIEFDAKAKAKALALAKIDAPVKVEAPIKVENKVKAQAKAQAPVKVDAPIKAKAPVKAKAPAKVETKAPAKVETEEEMFDRVKAIAVLVTNLEITKHYVSIVNDKLDLEFSEKQEAHYQLNNARQNVENNLRRFEKSKVINKVTLDNQPRLSPEIEKLETVCTYEARVEPISTFAVLHGNVEIAKYNLLLQKCDLSTLVDAGIEVCPNYLLPAQSFLNNTRQCLENAIKKR